MKLYYSVQNCGDGSAYPWFFTTKELAEWDQEHMDDGWGEMCVAMIEVINGTSCSDLMDAVQYWLKCIEDEDFEPWDLRKEYLGEFFPKGLPEFEVKVVDDYYHIFAEGEFKYKYFAHPKATEMRRVTLQERLNA